MKVDFSRGQWDNAPLTYAYSFRFQETPVFIQEDDCIANQKNDTFEQGFDNVTLMAEQVCAPGAAISASCAFEAYGAPLFVIAEKLHRCPDGALRYGDYMEVVLYENGVNVWRMRMNDGKVTWVKLLGAQFPVSAGERHTFSTRVTKTGLEIEACGRKFTLYVEDMYPSFYLGVSACEQIDRFSDMEITQA